jgi:ParD-like antitoxin of type II bacterial toxin-antitoxin system
MEVWQWQCHWPPALFQQRAAGGRNGVSRGMLSVTGIQENVILWQSATLYVFIMSNSLRVSSALFEAATSTGAVLARSTAQQVEHWARLGRALEEQGLTAGAAIKLLTAPVESEKALWKRKRRLQKRDLALVASGRVKQADMHLFSPELARRVKILNGPY